jgi:polyisoprenoid-binding protein YceI
MRHPLFEGTLLLCALGALAALAAPPALAAERAVTLDPATSKVSFTLDTTFHAVHGTMALTAGTIRFDTETGLASGEITVDATRTATGNQGRDETMHAEVLETARYPTIVFRARHVEGVLVDPGHSELRIVGVMSLHGSDHPMTLSAVVESGDGRVHGEMQFPIPYVEWGMHDPSFLVARAAKTVDLLVQAEGRWVN